MRKDLIALGIFLLFSGLVFVAFSRVAVWSEPIQYWMDVEKTPPQLPSESLFVQGNLASGDRFRINFGIKFAGGPFIPDTVIQINITDPNELTKTHQVPVKPGNPEFPEYLANYTGTYKVNAQSILPTAPLNYLALQKLETEVGKPQYPYSDSLLMGIVVLLGGFGIFLLGIKLSKRKRTLSRRRLPRRRIQA